METLLSDTSVPGAAAQSGMSSFDRWRQEQQTTLQGLGAKFTPNPQDLRDLTEVEKTIVDAHACLLSKQRELAESSNTATQLQSEILTIKESIEETKDDIQVAKDRVKYIRNPNANTSYYESWFPLQRPMKASSVPILLGLSLFLITFFFLSLLGMLGIDAQLALPERWFGSAYGTSEGTSYKVPFIIVTVLLLVSIGISVYGFLRKR